MRLISVVVPAYNVKSHLKRCVDSIIQQTYSHLEIILVDDGSNDGTSFLCDEIAKKDERIIVLHKENGGQADARNRGIEIARGEILSFIDADDYIEPDMYEKMVSGLEDDKVSFVAAGMVITDIKGNDRVISSGKKMILSKEEALMNLFDDGVLLPSSSNKLFRRNLFDKLRYVKGIVNEDTEIIFRIIDICDCILVLENVLYHYVLREGSTTKSDFGLRDYHSLIAYKSAVEVCKRSYPNLLPYAHYFEAREFYKAQERISSSKRDLNTRKFSFAVRLRLAKQVTKCFKWKQIRERYGRELLIYAATVFFGYRIIYDLMMMKQGLMKTHSGFKENK